MPSLKTKQLLLKVAKISRKKEEKISQKEIERKIHQIKYLTSKKKISKATLKKEITNLEKRLKGIFLLEEKLKEKEKEESRDIAALKKQIKDLKQKLAAAKDVSLRRKVEKLSHLIGDLMAREAVKKEVKLEEAKKAKKKAVEKKPVSFITLKKIDELQERILAIKKSGCYPAEKITALEQRLTDLEKKLYLPSALEKKEIKEPIKHKMFFGPSAEIKPKEVEKLEEEIKELPLPPPPKVKKRR